MGLDISNLLASCIANEGSKEERRQKDVELIRGHTNCYVDFSVDLTNQ